MPQRSPYLAALDFLREWEEGGTPALEDYVACCSGDSREMLELVADCVILDALACTRPFVKFNSNCWVS